MPRVLEHLEPKAVFHFFEDLTRIPHGSRNTKAVSYTHLTLPTTERV